MSLLPAALTALALASPCAIAAMPAPDFTALDRLIEDTRRATGYAPGLAIVVLRDGRIVHEAYSGHADIDAQVPVTRDTVFYIASATKPMFALNALLAEADGRLDLQAPLRTMFPDVAFDGIDADAVSAGELLFHASGVDNPDLAWAAAFSGVHDAASRQALVARTHADPETPHRTFRYTNVGYNLFSAWLDRRSATPWQQQLEARVFQPLGMHHTSASMDHAQRAGWTLARPYSLGSATPQRPLPLSKADATMHAAGGVVSTAPDLARFLAAQLPGGDSGGIPRALIARSQQPQVAVDAHYQDFARDGYAWGWYTGAYKGRRLLHHFGSFAGFHAHLSSMPDAGLAPGGAGQRGRARAAVDQPGRRLRLRHAAARARPAGARRGALRCAAGAGPRTPVDDRPATRADRRAPLAAGAAARGVWRALRRPAARHDHRHAGCGRAAAPALGRARLGGRRRRCRRAATGRVHARCRPLPSTSTCRTDA